MKIVDIIHKKVQKLSFTRQEIDYFVSQVVEHKVPDYLITSWLMAVYINDLTRDEAFYLASAMQKYGDKIDLSKFHNKLIIDKHSTGGVGDKVTLIIAPILAVFGITVAKISGRGLGFTGGTIDKLYSIGVKTDLSISQMLDQLKKHNVVVASQTQNITPADKILYSLRDVTGTVANYGLIASSILAKKFSILGTHVYLDVKYGSGSFCKNYKDAQTLISYLRYIAKKMNRRLTIIVSSMDEPLGNAIGNAIEVKETVDFLSGNVDKYPDVKKLIYNLVAVILCEANRKISRGEAIRLIDDAIKSKRALNKFYEWIGSQKGNVNLIKNDEYFKPKYHLNINATKDGYLNFESIAKIGMISTQLGAGRIKKDDIIDTQAGILLCKKKSDYVKKGEEIAICYSSKPISKEINNTFLKNCLFLKKKPKVEPIIKKIYYDKDK